jgi:cell fate regulator YaaT (PSP1 superfamily)
MCCLKFENDIYQEMRKGMPNQGEVVDTPQGKAKVTESNILRNIIKVRLIEEERTAHAPEKLSADLYSYTKDEIRRSKKTGKKNEPIKSVNEEIQQALDDEIIDIGKE